MNNLRIHHIGFAVKDIDKAISHYQKLFSLAVTGREVLKDRSIEVAFLEGENTKLELLQGTSSDDVISKFIAKRGESMHHICYEVSDISSELTRLKGLGVQLIDPVARMGAHKSLIAFLHPSSFFGVLTELCEIQS